MEVSTRVSLPLIFPALLVISTFQIITEVSGSEDGIAAGALFSVVILPFLFAGYCLARDAEEIKLVRSLLPVLGFYPFVYAVKSPISWFLAGLIILIPALSVRYYRSKDNTNSIVFAFSLLTCLGISNESFIVTGLILLSLVFYAFREKLELQYIASYIILWMFVNRVYGVDYLVLGMGFLFGFAVFVMIHHITKWTPALPKEKN